MDQEYIKSIIRLTKELQVLYVEDNKTQREQTIKMLSNFFDNIISVENGLEGFNKFKENQKSIDLIFTDIRMPMMDGIRMCEKIRELNSVVPIVIFSAYDDKELLMDAIKIGIDGYLTKPYTFDSVTNIIQKIMKKNHAQNIKYLKDGFYWDKDEETLHSKDHDEIKLSKNERVLIKLLTSAENKIVSSIDIENEIFDDMKSDNKRVRNLISRLNIKLENSLIESIYGEGYRIAVHKV